MAKRLEIRGNIISDNMKWIYDFLGMSATAPQDVKSFLNDAAGEDVELYIDSPGGNMTVASDIYNELRAYKGHSTALVNKAASAASLIMMGAEKVGAYPMALMMIHNSNSRAEGDYRAMESAGQMLRSADEAMINAYQLKTGKSREDLRALIDKTSWFNAQDALAAGLIDEIVVKEGEKADFQIVASIDDTFDQISAFAERLQNIKPGETLTSPDGRRYKITVCTDTDTATDDQKQDITNESGGGGRPVSDNQEPDLTAQRKQFADLRKKLYH